MSLEQQSSENLNYISQMITAILLVITEIKNNLKHLQQEKTAAMRMNQLNRHLLTWIDLRSTLREKESSQEGI